MIVSRRKLNRSNSSFFDDESWEPSQADRDAILALSSHHSRHNRRQRKWSSSTSGDDNLDFDEGEESEELVPFGELLRDPRPANAFDYDLLDQATTDSSMFVPSLPLFSALS